MRCVSPKIPQLTPARRSLSFSSSRLFMNPYWPQLKHRTRVRAGQAVTVRTGRHMGGTGGFRKLG